MLPSAFVLPGDGGKKFYEKKKQSVNQYQD